MYGGERGATKLTLPFSPLPPQRNHFWSMTVELPAHCCCPLSPQAQVDPRWRRGGFWACPPPSKSDGHLPSEVSLRIPSPAPLNPGTGRSRASPSARSRDLGRPSKDPLLRQTSPHPLTTAGKQHSEASERERARSLEAPPGIFASTSAGTGGKQSPRY